MMIRKLSWMLGLIWLLSTTSSLVAEPIGRLFTTPGERNALEIARKTRRVVKAEPTAPIQPTQPIELPDQVNLQGYVKRNDGKQGTVWINDKAMQEGTSNREVAVGNLPQNSNRISIKITGNGRYIGLKAGQVYNPETGRVHEARNHAAQGDGDSGTISGNFE